MTRTVPFLDVASMTAQIRADADAAWADLLRSGDFVRGAAVTRFEEEWADYCGVRHAVGVGNGTDALVLALQALGVRAGDDVVVPANTFVATVEAIVHTGARPVFADVDPDTLLLDARTLTAALTPRTRVVIVVHLFGRMPNMDALFAVAHGAGIAIIEDAAQAQGARWRGKRAGSFGVLGCFSFYPGKNLGALGDAGAVVTNDSRLADALHSLGDHGRVAGTRYEHSLVGFNSRLDTLQAAVLSVKLRHLDGWNASRRAHVEQYRQELADTGIAMVAEVDGGEAVHHLAVVQVAERDRVREELAAQGIATGIHYPQPCHLMAPYRSYCRRPLPVAEAAADRILSLPLSPHMTPDDVTTVCDALRNAVPAVPRNAVPAAVPRDAVPVSQGSGG